MMLSYTEKLKRLGSLKEAEFRESLLMDLFYCMPDLNPMYTHGQTERGVDILLCKDEVQGRRHIGVVVKSKKVNTRPSVVQEVSQQVNSAWSNARYCSRCFADHWVDEVWIFNSKDITDEGERRVRDQIQEHTRKRLTKFFCDRKVIDLVQKYLPMYLDEDEREIALREISLIRDIFDKWRDVFMGKKAVEFSKDMLNECEKASANPLVEYSRYLFHLYRIGKISRDDLVRRLFEKQDFRGDGDITLTPESMPIGVPIHVTDDHGNVLATAIRRAGDMIVLETVDGFFHSEQFIETGQVLKRRYQCSIEDVEIMGMENPCIEIHKQGKQRVAHCDTPKGKLEIREDKEGFVEIKMLVDLTTEEEKARYTVEPDFAEHKVRVRIDREEIEMPGDANDGAFSSD